MSVHRPLIFEGPMYCHAKSLYGEFIAMSVCLAKKLTLSWPEGRGCLTCEYAGPEIIAMSIAASDNLKEVVFIYRQFKKLNMSYPQVTDAQKAELQKARLHLMAENGASKPTKAKSKKVKKAVP